MIIYEGSCKTFIEQSLSTEFEIGEAITEKMNQIRLHPTHSEYVSWTNSLPALAAALNASEVPGDAEIGIEYNIKGNKQRIDAMICGKNKEGRETAVIIELKQWSSADYTEKQYFVHTNGGGGIDDYWHPSYQAANYAGIIQNFYEYVQDNNVELGSCSFLHNMATSSLKIVRNYDLYPAVRTSPVFIKGDGLDLASFIHSYIHDPCKDLLKRIDGSKMRPSPKLAEMLHDALDGNDFFSYSDEQADAVSTIVNYVFDSKKYGEKRTIIIRGRPGTGKSIVAINVLGRLIPRSKGKSNTLNAAYFTCNKAPRLLYSKKLIGDDYSKSAVNGLFKHPLALKDKAFNEYDCSLFDEAHRMYEWRGGTGLRKDENLIEKSIKASRVSVFFIDEDQAVTINDHATIDRIKEISERCGSKVIEGPKLETQFRVLGGSEYLDSIRYLLGYDGEIPYLRFENYDVRVFNTACEMRDELRKMDELYGDSRMVAGYTYEWITKDDFESGYDIVLDEGNFKARWNMNANDRSWLSEGSFDEVGCIHTCQGLDMNYCGVIIGKDMCFRDGHIVYDQNAVAKSDKSSGIRTCKDSEVAKKLIRNTYNVLLSRGMRGTFIYCEDEGLRQYFKSFFDEMKPSSQFHFH